MSNEDHTRLEARDLSLGYGDKPIVDDLTVTIAHGAITAIVGPNACGKSTLAARARAAAETRRGTGHPRRRGHHHAAHQGGRAHSSACCRSRRSRRRASPSPTWWPEDGFRTRSCCASTRATTSGRSPTPWPRPEVTALAGRPVDELSGGQRQRVWVAMVLAQQTPLILLDEPTTFLDIAHQIELLDLFAELNAATGPHHRRGAARPQPRVPVRRPDHRHEGRIDRRAGRSVGGGHRRTGRGGLRTDGARSSTTPKRARRW